MSSSLSENPALADATTRLDMVGSSWKWMVCVCLLLGITGGIRYYRDYEFAKLSGKFKECPFPMADFSTSLGSWRAVENSDTKLDPEIARVAGSSDHILRTYVDLPTGEKLHVMVLYGLAQEVFGHTPDICYPASGYRSIGPPKDHDITIPSTPGVMQPVRFRTQVFYHDTGPGTGQYTEAAYSFRLGDAHEGKWQPDMAGQWKRFRRQPGMFKIQLSREVSAAAANPDAPKSTSSESLMTEMIKEIEQRLASASSLAK